MRTRHGTLKIRGSAGSRTFDIILHLFLILFSISILFPFWSLIVISFSRPTDVLAIGFHLWPKQWWFDAYAFVFQNNQVISAYMVTIFRTVVGTSFMIFCTVITAYPLSKKKLPFRNYLTMFFLIPMFFSGGLIPTFLNIRDLGLIDSLWVYILPMAVIPFNIVIVRNYMMSIDQAVEESAHMDGAGYITILFYIIIPLCIPVLATVALWGAVSHWNSWFDSLLYIRDKNKIVLQLIIQRLLILVEAYQTDAGAMSAYMRNNHKELTSITVRAATILVTIGPIILAYPFAQKYFIKGIMIGSLKG